MARGGARPGAGRAKGVPNKKTAERVAEIEASGLTPLDFMLNAMRDEDKDFATRLDAAKAAAPYVHARLSTVEAKTENTHEVNGELVVSWRS